MTPRAPLTADGPHTVRLNGLVGMWFALAAILMLFMGLTSAYVVRRGLDPRWEAIRPPGAVFVGAVFLLASSVTLEIGRRSRLASRWFTATALLGLAFVAGLLVAWNQLAGAALRLATNAHSAFFYLLTALHGLHLLGGIAALTWLIPARARREEHVQATALYWHFLGALWLYLLVVLFVWR